MNQYDIVLGTIWYVTAYIESGYGDNASRTFTNGDEAVKYAKSLDKAYGASIWKEVTMKPLRTKVWP